VPTRRPIENSVDPVRSVSGAIALLGRWGSP
jgi:hypothetical protein